MLAGEYLDALRCHHHRLAAEEISGLRQILVRVNHEQHVGLEYDLVVESDVTRPDRAEPETVATAPDMRRMTEFAVALRLQHRVDRGADVGHYGARLCRSEARSHGSRHQIVFFAQQRRCFAEHDGAADLRELAAIARGEFA